MASEIQKWCQPHWDELRAAIIQAGMGELVARGGEAAALMLMDELRTGTARDVEGFDPLLRAWSMIGSRALDMGSGLIGCPLCFVQRHHDECRQPNCAKALPSEWIAGCVDSLKSYAHELGLIARPGAP